MWKSPFSTQSHLFTPIILRKVAKVKRLRNFFKVFFYIFFVEKKKSETADFQRFPTSIKNKNSGFEPLPLGYS